MTTQRSILLDELRRVDSHPSADELYAMVRRRLPRISLGTVYRNLEILSGLGAIRRIDSGGGLKRFDGNPEEHYHIRCVACDRLVDAPVAVAGVSGPLPRLPHRNDGTGGAARGFPAAGDTGPLTAPAVAGPSG